MRPPYPFNRKPPPLLCMVCVLNVVELPLTPGDPMNKRYPRYPVFISLLCSCSFLPMASFMESIHVIFGPPLFLLAFCFFPALLSFPKDPPFS